MSIELLFKTSVIFFVAILLGIRSYFAVVLRIKGYRAMKMNSKVLLEEGIARVFLRIWLVAGIPVYIVFYIFFRDEFSWTDLNFPIYLRFSGFLPCSMGLVFLIFVHNKLGTNWSTGLELRDHHVLITDGPYKYIRHPMYFSLILFYIGLVMIGSDLGILLFSSYIITILTTRIKKEEKLMTDNFGQEYLSYMGKTGALLPLRRKR